MSSLVACGHTRIGIEVLCSGDCHVFLGSSSLCTCEVEGMANVIIENCTIGASGLPYPFNLYAPHRPPSYVTITQLDTDTDKYIAYHPELPTVLSQADTPEEARANLVEATEMAVRHLVESGLPVPEPMAFPLAVDLAGDLVAMYGYPAPYNPFGPHAPQKPPQAPDVPLAQFNLAKNTPNATHLSSDGSRLYLEQMGNVRVCYWDDERNRYGSSFPCNEGLPADAVVLK